MKKFIKITAITLLILILFTAGFALYMYQTNTLVQGFIDKDESKLFYYPSSELASLESFNSSEFSIAVNDSVTIYTYHLRPTTAAKGNIFFIHGAGGNATTYANLLSPLVENGYSIYAAEWRGYGKSTGKPNYKGVLEDTEAAFEDFVKRTQTDSLKTIVYGMSLGGQLAIKIVMDNQERIDALVLEGSFESAQQIAIDYAPFDFIKAKHREHPENFNQDYVGSRDIKEIRNIPKLIIHSTKDEGVPFSHGENLYKNAIEPKTFWKTDTPHIMSLKIYPDETIGKIEGLWHD